MKFLKCIDDIIMTAPLIFLDGENGAKIKYVHAWVGAGYNCLYNPFLAE